MKNRIFTFGLGIVLLTAVSVFGQTQAVPPPTAAPQQAPPTVAPASGGSRVATVHIQRAIGECAEGKKAADDLTKRFTPKRNELEAKQAEITKLQQELQAGDKLMDEAKKAQYMRDIDRKTKDFNRDNDDANADYQQAMDQVINAIGGRMLQVVGVYSQKNGYDLVLNSANPGEVLWQAARVDITDEIIGAYNMSFGSSGATGAPAAPATPKTTPAKPTLPPATKPATPTKP